MTVPVSWPGVYIQEFAPGAPIEGVGTSTAAFLGPHSGGPPNEPLKVTSWEDFLRRYGERPLDGAYLWYGVRGFFENGGRVCYITRVSSATYAELMLNDSSDGDGKPTIRVRAREAGPVSPAISVKVDQVSAVSASAPMSAKLYEPTGTIASASGSSATLSSEAEAATFRPGDVITWTGSTEPSPVRVLRADGATLRLAGPLSKTYSSGAVRLANPRKGDTTIRVQVEGTEPPLLDSGSVIRLRLEPGGGAPAVEEIAVVRSVTAERISPSLTTYRVTLRKALSQELDLAAATPVTVESFEFNLTVTQEGKPDKTYENLGMDPEHPNYFARAIREDATGVILAEPAESPNVTAPPNNRPDTLATKALDQGKEDNLADIGHPHYASALKQLERVDDVNMVAAPGRTDAVVQQAVRDHCEKMQDRVAILDSRLAAPLFGDDGIEGQRLGLDTERGHATLYCPWLLVPPAAGRELLLVPPSGHVAGIFARIDSTRGVHKAPAGNEALVSGAVAVERTMSDVEQGELNVKGINVIRVFQTGGRPTVWGARTTATNTNWRYLNVRRLFNYLEESIDEGIRWGIFEPNNLALWQKLKRTISEFLTRVWRDGALFGASPGEAFYVRIDDKINTFTDQSLGRLNIEVGIRPVFPAEFIILRIGIWEGGAEVTEG